MMCAAARRALRAALSFATLRPPPAARGVSGARASSSDAMDLANGTRLVAAWPGHRAAAAPRLEGPTLTAVRAACGNKDRVAVVREPFAPTGAETPSGGLGGVVAPTPGAPTRHPSLARPSLTRVALAGGGPRGAAAVISAAATPTGRKLVDEYVKSGAGYTLARHGVDLLRYLHEAGVAVQLVPGPPAAGGYTSRGGRQSTNEVLMVAPTAFESNDQAAADNYFMAAAGGGAVGGGVRAAVLSEYAALYDALTAHGVTVRLFAHEAAHGTPDACFPNNWFSTHVDGAGAGTLVLYPMKAPNRAAERRPELVAYLTSLGRYPRVVDLTSAESADPATFLEGTGSMVLDHLNRVCYLALSERSNRALAEAWASALGFTEIVAFHSTDGAGRPIYHTNVVMAVGTEVAIVCGEAVPDAAERAHLLARLRATRAAVIDITREQMGHFCGNALEVLSDRGLPVLAMSTQAHDAFSRDQRKLLLKHVAAITHADIATLERVGGGGVRCCIAELH